MTDSELIRLRDEESRNVEHSGNESAGSAIVEPASSELASGVATGSSHVQPSQSIQQKPGSHLTGRTWWMVGLVGPAVVVLSWCLAYRSYAATLQQWSMLSAAAMVALVASLVAAYTDLRWRRIFNWITYPSAIWCLLLCGFGSLTATGAQWQLGGVPFSDSLLGFGSILFLLLLIFSVSGGGAGDVKLAAVIGAGLGLAGGLKALAFTFIVAGVLGFCWMILANGPVPVFRFFLKGIFSLLLPVWVEKPTVEERKQLTLMLPLAPFFAIGCALVIFMESFGGWLNQI